MRCSEEGQVFFVPQPGEKPSGGSRAGQPALSGCDHRLGPWADGGRPAGRHRPLINGEFDVLVSTNIIETGLDIPNTAMIINAPVQAERPAPTARRVGGRI